MSVNLSMVKWNRISVEIFIEKKNCLLYNAERDIYYISQNKIFSMTLKVEYVYFRVIIKISFREEYKY